MMEPGICELAAPADVGGFAAPARLAGEQARKIVRSIVSDSDSGLLLRRCAKFLGIACALALLLPILLIVGVLSCMVARVLGVPLCAAASSPFRLR